MKYLDFRKAIGALAAVVMVIGVSANTAQAANIYAVEAAAPRQLDALTANDPAEIGAWEYVYDIVMDAESQFANFSLNGADFSQIINQRPFSHGSDTGIHTQKWDGYAQSSGIKSWDRSAYGSYNSGGSWAGGAGAILGGDIVNTWHSIGDYQGSSSWAGVDPKFIGPGKLTDDAITGSVGTALLYNNRNTTGTLYNGVVMTTRLVHPDGPVADAITFRGYSYNGATVYMNTVTGPGAGGGGGGGGGAAVPEPSTLAMLGVALLGLCGFIRRRNG